MSCVLCLVFSGCKVSAEDARLCFQNSCYNVDVVRTPEEREHGLMSRDRLASGQGMLFIFDESGDYAFWMKNMTFSIDILWLDEAKSIVHIEENVPPCKADPCSLYSPGVEAKYVLEIPAGDSRRRNLVKGQKAVVSFSADELK